MPLYILEEKRDVDGLKLYACCRGTNHVRNMIVIVEKNGMLYFMFFSFALVVSYVLSLFFCYYRKKRKLSETDKLCPLGGKLPSEDA